MAKKVPEPPVIPSEEEVKAELERLKYKKRFGHVLRSTIYGLLVVAALSVLLATLFMPVMQVSGTSMSPTLTDGDILCLMKTTDMHTGDLCGFYWQNKLLIKRVIAKSGDFVDIDADGNVYVNSCLIHEPYINEKALGECDLEFPYQVPDSRYFVMGDHRSTSIDSRSSAIGCVDKEQLVGRVVLRVWPFDRITWFSQGALQ